MTKNGKIGYAILGLGIGMAHAAAAAESESAELLAACDLDFSRLAAFGELYPTAKRTARFEDLLNDPEIDIISICLPSAMHADFAVRAMQAGKNVLVEKPLDITPARAALIEEARQKTGKICGVVHQNRFNLNMLPIRQAITSGKMGKILFGTFAVKWYRDQKYYDRGGWRGTWEMDGGGSLINQAIHTVDLMCWLMGDVASVTSTMRIASHRISTEDLTASLVQFKSGAVATFVSTTCAFPGISTEIDIYGTDGSIEADADTIKLWKMKNSPNIDAEEAEMLSLYGTGNAHAAKAQPHAVYGHRHVVEDMIAAVRDHRQPEVCPTDGIRAVSLVNAIYQSAKTGQTVSL